jgi:uncharacterized membrane protein YdbT with pleckstrin-like domain
MEGEAVVYQTRPHWAVLLPAVPLVILSAVVLVVALLGAGFGVFFTVGLVVGVPVGAATLVLMSRYMTTRFTITDRRVLVTGGLLHRYSREILLRQLEGIGIDLPPLGRLFGYGTVFVTGTGTSRRQFSYLTAPLEFRQRLREQVSALTGRVV